MLPRISAERKLVKRLSHYLPAFTDVFDEESFYIFCFFFVLATIIVAFILSRVITIKDAGHIDPGGVEPAHSKDKKKELQ